MESALMRLVAERMGLEVRDWTPMLEDGFFLPPTNEYYVASIWTDWDWMKSSGLKALSCDELKSKSVAELRRNPPPA
jgi:hypothetical protein